jgi:hypothetical protein
VFIGFGGACHFKVLHNASDSLGGMGGKAWWDSSLERELYTVFLSDDGVVDSIKSGIDLPSYYSVRTLAFCSAAGYIASI